MPQLQKKILKIKFLDFFFKLSLLSNEEKDRKMEFFITFFEVMGYITQVNHTHIIYCTNFSILIQSICSTEFSLSTKYHYVKIVSVVVA